MSPPTGLYVLPPPPPPTGLYGLPPPQPSRGTAMAAAGAPLGGRYQLVADSTGKIDILGSGAYGIVCRAVDLQQDTTVALKLIFKAPGEPLQARVGGELVLQHLQPHANVVRLLELPFYVFDGAANGASCRVARP